MTPLFMTSIIDHFRNVLDVCIFSFLLWPTQGSLHYMDFRLIMVAAKSQESYVKRNRSCVREQRMVSKTSCCSAR